MLVLGDISISQLDSPAKRLQHAPRDAEVACGLRPPISVRMALRTVVVAPPSSNTLLEDILTLNGYPLQ
jgi:hypothetical protein